MPQGSFPWLPLSTILGKIAPVPLPHVISFTGVTHQHTAPREHYHGDYGFLDALCSGPSLGDLLPRENYLCHPIPTDYTFHKSHGLISLVDQLAQKSCAAYPFPPIAELFTISRSLPLHYINIPPLGIQLLFSV